MGGGDVQELTLRGSSRNDGYGSELGRKLPAGDLLNSLMYLMFINVPLRRHESERTSNRSHNSLMPSSLVPGGEEQMVQVSKEVSGK